MISYYYRLSYTIAETKPVQVSSVLLVRLSVNPYWHTQLFFSWESLSHTSENLPGGVLHLEKHLNLKLCSLHIISL